jgi:hypothetical protein
VEIARIPAIAEIERRSGNAADPQGINMVAHAVLLAIIRRLRSETSEVNCAERPRNAVCS